MKTTAILLAPAIIALAATPAKAGPDSVPLTVTGAQTPDPDTIRVSYADLNMTTPESAAVLRTRVSKAINHKCDQLYDGAMLEQAWGCKDIAWGAAKPQLEAVIGQRASGLAVTNAVVSIRFAKR